MAAQLCFYLLLMAVTHSVITSTHVTKNLVVQSSADTYSKWQETPRDIQQPEDQYRSTPIDRGSIASWRETAEETQYATVAATKRQCREEIMSKGYAAASDECKGKLKYERALCQLQADKSGVAVSDLCKKLVSLQTCKQKQDCKNSATKACCWVPGSDHTMQCISEVPPSNLPTLPIYSEVSKRADLLNDISILINGWFGPTPDDNLHIMVLPIGQGDCVAMYCPSGNLVMFDCGSSNRQKALTAEEVKSVILNKVKGITIFISHGDVDHYRLLPTIFSDTSVVDRVIIGGSPDEHAESEAIRQWMRTMANQSKLYAINKFSKCIGDCNGKLQRVAYLAHSDQWSISGPMTTLDSMDICGSPGVKFDIIAANVGKTKNQKSIVLKVTGGPQSVLLAGDMEGSAAKAVAKAMPARLKSNVFQISHHGAGTEANKLDWLQAIKPEKAFVSHAHIGQYGHPRCDAIQRLLSIGSIGTNTLLPWTHKFSCAMNGKQGFVGYSGKTCHNIFSTYPSQDDFCVIVFSMDKSLSTIYTCCGGV